ncbi:MAG: preprotein translocase subunit Sec61beta [Candidatus Pacearchaeota archaeon]
MAGELPAGFGGLMRYKEEYKSKINLSPAHVIGFVMLIILFVIILRIFFPIA